MTAIASGRHAIALSSSRSAIRARVIAFWAAHRADLAWLTPAVAAGVTLQAVNMAHAPQRIDDEGTYTAQAWAVARLGELAHYTYWYDHPPLGWLQLAAYGRLTLAFDRYPSAIMAMREAMLVFAGAAMLLLWLLVRRVGLSRPAASFAVALFALSPLAVQFHRSVYLDNVAVPWLLAAFLLAHSRRNQLAGFAASALCFVVAVLSKETFLLALPFLAWVMVRCARRETRPYTLSVAASVFALAGLGYVLFAALKGELLPGRSHVSLVDGIWFQLVERPGSGSVLDASSPLNRTLSLWAQFDPVLLVLGSLAAVVGVVLRPTRPYAVMAIAVIAVVFRPGGYTPVPYVIVLLPLFALLLAAVTDRAVVALRAGVAARLGGVGWLAALVAAAVVAAPLWTHQLRVLTTADLDAPSRAAEQWIERTVPVGTRMIVDDSMWVDLVRAGFSRDDVVWYYKVDTDPQVRAAFPHGWRDAGYVVTTQAMRLFSAKGQVSAAIAHSVVVARFGTDAAAIEVRRVVPDGATVSAGGARLAEERRRAFGSAVRRNRDVVLPAAASTALLTGLVDERITVALAAVAQSGVVRVASIGAVPGDVGPRRAVLLSSLGGAPLRAGSAAEETARRALLSLAGDSAPRSIVDTSTGLLVTFGLGPTP